MRLRKCDRCGSGSNEGHCPALAATMRTKHISRRLERLEEEIRPGEPEIVVLHVIGVTPDGGRVKGPEFKVETPRRTVKPGPR
jgi:hypothetical protein